MGITEVMERISDRRRSWSGSPTSLLPSSGPDLGEQTYLPDALHALPPKPSMAAVREEEEEVMFGALDNLFKNTGVKPKEIGILVVNCSIFNPTPSLSAMIVNRYKLRGNIRSFNLGGMGCSAGVIAVDLASELLQVHRATYAVVVSTENITQNWYYGNRKSMPHPPLPPPLPPPSTVCLPTDPDKVPHVVSVIRQ